MTPTPLRKTSQTKSFGTPNRQGHDASTFYARKLYDGKAPTTTRQTTTDNTPDTLDTIYCHDSRAMSQLPNNSIHLMITSPPYNVGKDYDEDLSLDAYKALLGDVLKETYRVLVDGGRACINIANIGRKPYIPLNGTIATLAEACGFHMRGEIIWDKGASAGSSCAWGSWRSANNPSLRDVHEYICVFSKTAYGRKSQAESTISRDEFIAYTKSIWQFPTTSAKRAQHPAPFPLELPRRLIELYSFKGDIVLDPFIGSGTTALAALDTGRHYIGYDITQDYVDIANTKIKQWHTQNSRIL